MDIDRHMVVLGAAGKMGSGIALLLLEDMALQSESRLTLLDVNVQGFSELRKYLRAHLQKYAEKNINRLRKAFLSRQELVDNGEIIEEFIEESLGKTRFVTSLEECRDAHLIFEAIIEDVTIKGDVLKKINNIAHSEAIYFSNTSSIPIHILQEKSGIGKRLIGFHFYNPPAVQKLLEIVIPEGTNQKTKVIAEELAKRLDKKTVYSADVAGFIGNGHFIREVCEACSMVEKKPETIASIDAITRDDLIRPMGIFQLADYVGLDVVQHIARVMSQYQKQAFKIPLIDRMIEAGIKGGQHGDGSQKDGLFFYQKGLPVEVYDLETKRYRPLNLEKFIPGKYSWKSLSKDKNKNEKLSHYFKHLLSDESSEGQMAIHFLENSRDIAHHLVKNGVAHSIEDVDAVLQNGFFHLYGVDEPWKKEQN